MSTRINRKFIKKNGAESPRTRYHLEGAASTGHRKPMPPRFDGIPGELRARPLWAVWRYELPEGDPSPCVVIHSPIARCRKVEIVARTPGTYEATLSYYARSDYDGLCLHLEGDLCAVWIGAAVDPGGGLQPWSARILAALDTVAFLDPHGAGVIALCRAPYAAPVAATAPHSLEIITGPRRYIPVTGWKVTDADRIAPSGAAVRALIAQYRGGNPDFYSAAAQKGGAHASLD